MTKHSGYERQIVSDFLTAHGLRREDGKLGLLNDLRLSESNREMIARWEAKPDPVDTDKLDKLLMRYGLMLFELEDWARQQFGRDGFVDPYSEPKELVA